MYVAFCDGPPPGLETGVDFRGQVCIGVTCFGVTCFGLKKGQDLENRTAHPLQWFLGVQPPPLPPVLLTSFNVFFFGLLFVYYLTFF